MYDNFALYRPCWLLRVLQVGDKKRAKLFSQVGRPVAGIALICLKMATKV